MRKVFKTERRTAPVNFLSICTLTGSREYCYKESWAVNTGIDIMLRDLAYFEHCGDSIENSRVGIESSL